MCDRNFGVGADGVIFAMPGINGTDYTMRIFNSDGSEPEVGSWVDFELISMSKLLLCLKSLTFDFVLVDVWQWSSLLC